MARSLQPEAIELIDKRLKNVPLARDAIRFGDARQLFVEATKACVGIRESGRNGGYEVELFQKTVGIRKGDAWCMAFMQTCLAYAELKTGKSSPLYASGGCMAVWQRSPEGQRVKVRPLAGAIAIWQHTNDPAHGHTGSVMDCDGVTFHAIEGNTADGAASLNNTVGQTGEGVRFTHRRYDLFNSQNGDMLLLGCLKPF